jgi:hypothetical protein
MILSQDFLKAVFLAFVVIAAVTIAPLDGTSSNTPFLANATVAGARERAFVAPRHCELDAQTTITIYRSNLPL